MGWEPISVLLNNHLSSVEPKERVLNKAMVYKCIFKHINLVVVFKKVVKVCQSGSRLHVTSSQQLV